VKPSTNWGQLKVQIKELFKTFKLKLTTYLQLLRRNPPEVRVTCGQKPSTKITYKQTSVQLFKISSKKIFFSSNTKSRKQMLNFV